MRWAMMFWRVCGVFERRALGVELLGNAELRFLGVVGSPGPSRERADADERRRRECEAGSLASLTGGGLDPRSGNLQPPAIRHGPPAGPRGYARFKTPAT